MKKQDQEKIASWERFLKKELGWKKAKGEYFSPVDLGKAGHFYVESAWVDPEDHKFVTVLGMWEHCEEWNDISRENETIVEVAAELCVEVDWSEIQRERKNKLRDSEPNLNELDAGELLELPWQNWQIEEL